MSGLETHTFDISVYRNKNETEREWQLRKLFIERFRDQFEHDRLLCLAQCFVNIKTMGCRYSDRIMKQIKDLTTDFDPIVDDYQGASKPKKLKK